MQKKSNKKNTNQSVRPFVTEKDWGKFTSKLRDRVEAYFGRDELSIIDQFIQTASGEVEPAQIEERRARADHSFCRAQ